MTSPALPVRALATRRALRALGLAAVLSGAFGCETTVEGDMLDPETEVESEFAAGMARGEMIFLQVYQDSFRGWPLDDIQRAHGVYGSFLNPTSTWPSGMPGLQVGYHQAVDIPVNDATGGHPVYAVEGGRVAKAWRSTNTAPVGRPVNCGGLVVSHFQYAHVLPDVAAGDQVRPGQRIGTTCPGWWHIHLEEHAVVDGQKVKLNPLRPGGKLAPIADGAPPVIAAMRIYPNSAKDDPTPQPMALDQVRGVVVPVALAEDVFPTRSWSSQPLVKLHVYRAHVLLARGGKILVNRRLFQLDRAPGPTWAHFFRPLTRRAAPVGICAEQKPADCNGRYWLRLWDKGWDTTAVKNGDYLLTLTVEDQSGNKASKSLAFRVAN